MKREWAASGRQSEVRSSAAATGTVSAPGGAGRAESGESGRRPGASGPDPLTSGARQVPADVGRGPEGGGGAGTAGNPGGARARGSALRPETLRGRTGASVEGYRMQNALLPTAGAKPPRRLVETNGMRDGWLGRGQGWRERPGRVAELVAQGRTRLWELPGCGGPPPAADAAAAESGRKLSCTEVSRGRPGFVRASCSAHVGEGSAGSGVPGLLLGGRAGRVPRPGSASRAPVPAPAPPRRALSRTWGTHALTGQAEGAGGWK